MRKRLAGMLVLLAGGCNEQGFTSRSIRSVAVVAGDFDDLSQPLERQDVRHDVYEGIITNAVYDREWNHEASALKVETLVGDLNELSFHDAVFFGSGTRGLGEREYNGVESDDHIVTDAAALDNIRTYVDRGGVLLLTDWTYDLLEACWPDKVEWLNEDTTYDDAQKGEIGTVTGTVRQDALSTALDADTVSLTWNYSNWAVPESVAEDVLVWIEAPADYRIQEGGIRDIDASPVLLSFDVGQGKVIYSAFHLDAQRAGFTDTVLRQTVGTLVKEQDSDE